MDSETARLVTIAKENPWRLFGCGDLARILGVDDKLISAINAHRQTPFVGKKARPEWLIAWLQSNPGFSVK